MTINNYNSTISLSQYTIGDTYAFYVRNDTLRRFSKADKNTVNRYAPLLTEAIKVNKINLENSGRWLNLTRIVGVIVNKHKAADSRDVDKITVMFQYGDDNYVLTKYAVGYHEVMANGKEDVPPAAVIRIAAETHHVA